MTLSFIPEDLPAPFLTYLKASLESPLKETQELGPALLPGGVKLSKAWALQAGRLHPVSVIVNSHNYYYLERWARGGQGHGWGG